MDEALASFLRKRGLSDSTALATLSEFGVNSLYDLKMVMEDPDTLGELKEKLKGNRIALKALGGLSGAAINNAIYYSEDPEAEAHAQAFKAFIRKNGLPAGIEREFADAGITTLEELREVKQDKAPGGRLDQLKARLDKAGMPSATRQVDRLRVADIQQEIDDANAPEAMEAAEKKAELAQAIAEAKELRTQIEAKTQTQFDSAKSEVEAQYQAVLDRIKDASRTDVEAALERGKTSQQELSTLLQTAIGNASNAKKVLDSVDTKRRTRTELIEQLEMLCGLLVSASGAQPKHSALVKLPEDLEGMERVFNDQWEFTHTYKGNEATAFAVATAQQSCSVLAVSAEASGGGFVGTGVAAVSAAASYADARKASKDAQDFQSETTAKCGEIHYIYKPQQGIQFDRDGIELSDAARKDLEALVKLPTDQQRQGILRFYQRFGSHFFLRYYLGGRYEFTVTGKSSSKTSKEELTEAVAARREAAVSASASYAGVGAAASGAASAKGEQSDASAQGRRVAASSADDDVTVKTRIVGGAALALQNVSRETWAQTLKHNSTWAIIDRADPLAVWELVALDTSLTDDVKGLAPLLEEVWVRRVFLDSVEGSYPLLHRYIKENPAISSCDALDGAVKKVSAGAAISAEPQLTVVVETATSESAAHPKVVVRSRGEGLKLIGGGAIINWQGAGSFLTGSYPKEGAWVASGKDHFESSPATVTASAIYLFDPNDEWDVTMVSAETEEGSNRPEITANLPAGYALTGGGAKVDWGGPGMLLTANCPVTNADGTYGWRAKAKDHLHGDSGKATAWVFGIRPRNGDKVKPSKIYWNESPQAWHLTLEDASSTGEVIVGGGAEVTWRGAGGMLQASGLSSGKSADQRWKAEAKDHMEYDGSLELTMAIICRKGQLADA